MAELNILHQLPESKYFYTEKNYVLSKRDENFKISKISASKNGLIVSKICEEGVLICKKERRKDFAHTSQTIEFYNNSNIQIFKKRLKPDVLFEVYDKGLAIMTERGSYLVEYESGKIKKLESSKQKGRER